MLRAILNTGGSGLSASFVGGAGGAGDAKGDALEAPEKLVGAQHFVLTCMVEAVEGAFYFLEVMHRVLYILEAVDGELCPLGDAGCLR